METLDAIHQRRAVRAFDANHRFSDTEMRTLLDAARHAPTAFNIQHWRFVVVTDPAIRQQIRAAAWDQAQVTDASLLVIMTADRLAWKDLEAPLSDAPANVRETFGPMIEQYYQGREQVQIDECHRSCGLAGSNLMLAAKALGYDSCPMDGFDFAKVAEIIKLPDSHVISYMIAIGKALQPAYPKLGWRPYESVVIENTF